MSLVDCLTPEGQRAWRALEPRLRRAGHLVDVRSDIGLMVLVECWSFYVLTERVAQRCPRDRRARREAAAARLRLRRLAAEWFLIAPARIPLAPLTADGFDAELAALFAPAGAMTPKRRVPHVDR